MVPTNELHEHSPRSKTLQVLGYIMGLVLIGVIVILALKPAQTKQPPDFELALLSGGKLSSDELKGSPVVLNFFASWCAPCREEAPLIERMWQRYRNDGVRFVGVNIKDTKANAKRFVREYGVTYPVVADPNQVLAGALDVNGLPQTFFVNEEWKLLSVSSGERIGARSGTGVFGAISATELERNVRLLLRSSSHS
jgi:cytochrome c biogenesis protein CcmG/thiol:disulfide interchange protein DsbE